MRPRGPVEDLAIRSTEWLFGPLRDGIEAGRGRHTYDWEEEI